MHTDNTRHRSRRPARNPLPPGVVDPYGIIIKPIPDKTVVLTFDDACRSHATFVAPLLKEYGFGGSFYITTAFGFKTRKDWYMTWEQIKAMHDMGFEIGNHTFNHQSSTAVLPRQYIRSVEVLEQDFEKHGIPPVNNLLLPDVSCESECSFFSEREWLFVGPWRQSF